MPQEVPQEGAVLEGLELLGSVTDEVHVHGDGQEAMERAQPFDEGLIRFHDDQDVEIGEEIRPAPVAWRQVRMSRAHSRLA